jgi:spore coat protein U-like protein
MKANLKDMTKALAALALAISTGLAYAATATANLNVSATITPNCTISTTPVAFGSYDPVSGSDVTAAGTVIVACTKNAPSLSIGLGNGSNYASGRKMNGASFSDKLAYSLMQPVSNAVGAACPAMGAGTEWTAAAGALTLTTPTGKAARTYNVCGQLAAGQDVSVDTYSDLVIATINF